MRWGWIPASRLKAGTSPKPCDAPKGPCFPASFRWSRTQTGHYHFHGHKTKGKISNGLCFEATGSLVQSNCLSSLRLLQDSLSHWYRTFDFKTIRVPLTKGILIHFKEGTIKTHVNYWLGSLYMAVLGQAWVSEALVCHRVSFIEKHGIIHGQGVASFMAEKWHHSWRGHGIIHGEGLASFMEQEWHHSRRRLWSLWGGGGSETTAVALPRLPGQQTAPRSNPTEWDKDLPTQV